jgi:hypothetical protein
LRASGAVFARFLVEVAVVNASMLPVAAPPVLLMTACMVGAAAWGYLRDRGGMDADPADREVPSQLGTALGFGLLYAVVLVAAAAAREQFGTGGLYAVSALSGLTDVDAITISAAQLVGDGRVDGVTTPAGTVTPGGDDDAPGHPQAVRRDDRLAELLVHVEVEHRRAAAGERQAELLEHGGIESLPRRSHASLRDVEDEVRLRRQQLLTTHPMRISNRVQIILRQLNPHSCRRA